MTRNVVWRGLILITTIGLLNCGSSSDGDSDETPPIANMTNAAGEVSQGSPSDSDTSSDTNEDGTDTDGGDSLNAPAADCAYDEGNKGKAVGKHIEDFPLEWWAPNEDNTDYDKTRFDFHTNCGGDASVVWIFLSTGWCGACESYAQTVQGQYAMLKDKGLRIVWIVGEDKEYMAPSVEYIKRYIAQKNVEFPIIRDGNFLQTKRFLDPSVAG
ncbi:MAG: hypothetical protein VX624_11895, partial [Pseudomonadota bacterium]|nr:hypothetical protein [Pseudomonadota bacterium]